MNVWAYIAQEPFEDNQLRIQMLDPANQLVLAAFALLQVLHTQKKS